MNRRLIAFHCVLVIFFFSFLVSCTSSARDSAVNEIDPTLVSWTDRCNTFLATITDRFGAVDYRAARTKLDTLQPLIDELAAPRRFSSAADRTAFLINAYNLLVIGGLCTAVNIDSPREIPGFFDKQPRKILGKEMTLDQWRDTQLRPLADPRIHAALCYGAVGSPPLAAEAYRGESLSAQLDRQCRRWINHPTHVAPLGDLLLVSALFQWFEPDFRVEPYGSVAGFLKRYAQDDSQLARMLGQKPPPPIEFLEFNWAINAADSASPR